MAAESTVLLVEDDASVRTVLADVLAAAGLAVESAVDGADALARFTGQRGSAGDDGREQRHDKGTEQGHKRDSPGGGF